MGSFHVAVNVRMEFARRQGHHIIAGFHHFGNLIPGLFFMVRVVIQAAISEQDKESGEKKSADPGPA